MCVQPLDGWLARERGASGKRAVSFRISEGLVDRPVRVPCGSCVECKSRQASEWAVRIMHEASVHDFSWFCTLTYEKLPVDGSLDKRDLSLFFKRLRRDVRFRYFAVGEYGSWSGRPHYHVCLFGPDIRDKRRHTTRGDHQVYTSEWLSERWAKGFVEIGSLTPKSAAYVARYLSKGKKDVASDPRGANRVAADVSGAVAGESAKVPEFAVMSRRPGIGREWFEKFREEVLRDDAVLQGSRLVKPPRYYDKLALDEEPEALERIKRARVAAIKEDQERGTRWLARRAVGEARVNLFKREPQ